MPSAAPGSLPTPDAPAVLPFGAPARAAAAEPFSRLEGAPAAPALIQEMWWRWVRGHPVQLPHERLSHFVRIDDADPEAAAAAVRAVLDRHATLRSRFAETDGRLALSLNDAADIPVEMVRVGDDGAGEQARFLEAPLRIEGGRLGRARVIAGADGGVLIGLMFHHMVFDARSKLLVERELRERLAPGADPARTGKPAPQYLDYAAWERAWAQGGGRAVTAHWREWLAAAPALRNPGGGLLTWRPGHKVYYHFELAGAAVARMKALAAAADSAAFKVLLAATGLAVARWSGQDRLVLRVIGDQRTSRRLPGMVGNLVCTDLVEVRVPPDRDFLALLDQVSLDHKAAMQLRCPNLLGLPDSDAFPDVSAGSIGASAAVTLNYMPVPRAREDAPASGPEAPARPVAVRSAQREFWPVPVCPINLRIWDRGARLECRLEFDDDAIAEADQRRLAALFIDAVHDLPAGAGA